MKYIETAFTVAVTILFLWGTFAIERTLVKVLQTLLSILATLTAILATLQKK
jgi:hypothetical protein